MTSAQHPNRVYFSSLDRSPVDSNTDFTITFDTPIERAKNFEVVTASFPNTFHQFAPYETVLYFYHELFFGGTIAIGIPLSTTLFVEGGATGENNIPSLRPAGRQEYIDGRYFLDGEDLQDYLNDWIQSLSTSWPTQASGLRPFYHPDDDPTKPVVYVADEASSGITFSNLAFDYDTTTSAGGRGSLKFTFSDSSVEVVRIASVVDYGVLRQDWIYPSQLGYKMGFTTLEPQAFDSVINITSANNQFQVNYITQYMNFTTANSRFNIKFTDDTGTTQNVVIPIVDSPPNYPNPSFQRFAENFPFYINQQNLPNVVAFTTYTSLSGTVPQIRWTLQFKNCQVGTTAFINCSTNSTFNTLIGVASGDISLGTITGSTTNLTFDSGTLVGEYLVTEPLPITISSTPIDYSIAGLVARLNEIFSASSLTQSDLTASLSSLQLQFSTITKANVLTQDYGYSINFDAGSAVQQACKTSLGFTSNTNTIVKSASAPVTFTAPNNVNTEGLPTDEEDVAEDPINLIRTSNIYFASSLSGGEALSSAGRKDILFSVPLTAPVGSVQLYQSTLSGIVVNRPPDVLRNLRVTLLDDNFQTMEQLPQNASIAVEIHFAYQDDNQVNNISTIVRY